MSFHVSFCSYVFSPFSIAITSLGEERANLSAFRTVVRFVLVWICWFPFPLGVWEGLWSVIVALPGLLPFFCICIDIVEIRFGIANRQIPANFYGVICLRHTHIFVSGR